MKVPRVWGLVMVMALLVAACGDGETAETSTTEAPGTTQDAGATTTEPAPDTTEPMENPTIAYIPHLTGHPVWLIAKEGFDDAAAEMGFEGLWIGSESGDVQELVETLDSAIAQGVDGIAIAAINPSAMQASIDRAVEMGIPVVTVLADASDSQRNAFVGSDVEEIGRLAAEGLIEATGGSGKVGVVLASLDLENQRQILDAFEANIAGTDLEIVATEADNSDLAVSVERIGAILTAHPDLAALFGINANVPIAACQVFKERGLTKDDVAMIGMDDLDESLACVRDDTITGLIAQNFYGAGYVPAAELMRVINGETVEDFTDSGVALVDPSTIDTYAEDFRGVASGS